MLVSQSNTAQFYFAEEISPGAPRDPRLGPATIEPASLPLSFYKKKATSSDLPEVPRDFRIFAADLGRYSTDQLENLSNSIRLLDSLPVLIAGNEANGFYLRRNLFVEPGTLNTGSRRLSGQFLINPETYVNSQPASNDTTSSLGRFPVNGQFFLNSQYRPNLLPVRQNSGIPNRQYPIGDNDPIASQFLSYDSRVTTRGQIDRSPPFYITAGEFRKGRFDTLLGYSAFALSEISISDFQANSLKSNTRSQILAEGQNTFNGVFRPTAPNTPSLTFNTQKGNVLIEGSYNENGEYEIAGQALVNGQNVVTGYALQGTTLSPVEITIQGRYTSGGAFIIQSPDNGESRSLVRRPTEREQAESAALENPTLPDYLGLLPDLVRDLFQQISRATTGIPFRSPGLYLNFAA
jgi:hypothetical protein